MYIYVNFVLSLDKKDILYHHKHIEVELHKHNRGCTCASSIVWCHQESNRGHKDFQSFALPTEL